jgi:TRAP transporter TAXI family solute receptor
MPALRRRLAAAVVLPLLAAAPAAAQTYGIGTMQPGTLNHTTGSTIARVMQQKLGLQTRVQPMAGEAVIMPLVAGGEIDFGIANVLEVLDAYEGRGAGGRQDKLRVVGAIHPLRVGFFARRSGPIQTIADLKGRRVVLGFSAMRTIDRLAQALLATASLEPKDVQPVLVPNVIRGADDFLNGNADVFLFALGAGKVNEVDAGVGGIRIVPVPGSPESLAAARRIFQYLYVTEVAPRPGLTGVVEPTRVMTYDNLLVTGAGAKDEFVHKVVAGLAAEKADLVTSAPWLVELTPDGLYKKLPVPYHPGAVKWFQENRIEARE